MGAEGVDRYGRWQNPWEAHLGANVHSTSPTISKNDSPVKVRSTSNLSPAEMLEKLNAIKEIALFIIKNANTDFKSGNITKSRIITRAIPISQKVNANPVYNRISSCKIEDLTPEEIGEISKSLNEIEADIKKIPSLTIEQKEIEEVPPSIKYLTGLMELKLGLNKLTRLPDLSGLKKLAQLDISHNPDFKELPDFLNGMAEQFIDEGINIEATQIKKAPQILLNKLHPANQIRHFTK